MLCCLHTEHDHLQKEQQEHLQKEQQEIDHLQEQKSCRFTLISCSWNNSSMTSLSMGSSPE